MLVNDLYMCVCLFVLTWRSLCAWSPASCTWSTRSSSRRSWTGPRSSGTSSSSCTERKQYSITDVLSVFTACSLQGIGDRVCFLCFYKHDVWEGGGLTTPGFAVYWGRRMGLGRLQEAFLIIKGMNMYHCIFVSFSFGPFSCTSKPNILSIRHCLLWCIWNKECAWIMHFFCGS